jgi:hypothetical protein
MRWQWQRMKDKNEIVSNWLPRYTGVPLAEFGEHILLTNFGGYLHSFARLTGAPWSASTGRCRARRPTASP